MNDIKVEDVFREGGILAKNFDDYEMRQGQMDLAKKIEQCVSESKHLIVEAPTGSGKGFGYLVPLLHRINAQRESTEDSGNRVVVATANIALQEQLYTKDLPLLADMLPWSFEYALVKGRNNYLCRDKLDEFLKEKGQLKFGWGEEVSAVTVKDVKGFLSPDEMAICEWSESTETGDKSSLSIEPDGLVWSNFSRTAEECLGEACPHSDICFANLARGALLDKDVIIVNYHLLFAAVKVRTETTKDIVLPKFDYLICDEAHRIADIARGFWGWNCTQPGLEKIINKFGRIVSTTKVPNTIELPNIDDLIGKARRAMDKLWPDLGMLYGTELGALRIKTKGQIKAEILSFAMKEMGGVLDDIARYISEPKRKAVCKQCAKSALNIGERLGSVSELDDPNSVYYLDRYGKSKSIRICKRKLDVGEDLWSQMFEKAKSVILTSATLAIDKDFSFIREETGMKEGKELIVSSPFNYRKQSCIVLSANAPDPTKQDYAEKVSKAITEIIRQAGGRTLGLFTSYRNLNYVTEYVRDKLPEYNIMKQGERPRTALVEAFKAEKESVLFGTESFWTGIDVPGESLSCLVIDKIPFPSPGDPILEALSDKADGKGFYNVILPRAVLQFRQGAGRLIRRSSDRGIIVVLDNRLITKGYGSSFVDSLPRMVRAKGISNGQIRRWLESDGIPDG